MRIGEYNNLKWPFDETFCDETIFKDSTDFKIKINNLINDKDLYEKCLNIQNNIFKKYFNKKWIKEYILYYL